MNDKVAYSIRQVTEITGIGRTKIFSEIRCGKLIARKLGRRTLITAKELERWIQQFPTIQPVGHAGSEDSSAV